MRSVLIVDDSRSIRLALAQAIRQAWGPDVEILGAEDQEKAWSVLETTKLDVVFLDMIMPGETETPESAVGLEILRDIAEEKPEVPVVVVSGLPHNHPIMIHAISLGAIAHLPKPVRPADVKRLLENLTPGSQSDRLGYIQ